MLYATVVYYVTLRFSTELSLLTSVRQHLPKTD